MARGRRIYTPDEKLEMINAEINECEERLKTLKEQKKQLEQEIHDKELAELDSLIRASGKTIGDIKLMLV